MKEAIKDGQVTTAFNETTIDEGCRLNTSDAADELLCRALGGRRLREEQQQVHDRVRESLQRYKQGVRKSRRGAGVIREWE
ncbi:hypothetical protein BGV22_20450 [Clostridioides difficile]|nr:hypothetical protein BGV22_20450 [Clostridioides difficile]